MNDGPVMSAYPDEQDMLDNNLSEEVAVWRKLRDLLDDEGYTLTLGLVDGMPSMKLVKA